MLESPGGDYHGSGLQREDLDKHPNCILFVSKQHVQKVEQHFEAVHSQSTVLSLVAL